MSSRRWLLLGLLTCLLSALSETHGSEGQAGARVRSERCPALLSLRGGSAELKVKKSAQASQKKSVSEAKKRRKMEGETSNTPQKKSKDKPAKEVTAAKKKLPTQKDAEGTASFNRAVNETSLNTLFFSGAPYRLKGEELLQSLKDHVKKHLTKVPINILGLRFPGRRPRNNGWGFFDLETAAMASEVIDMTQEHPFIVGERTVKLRRALPIENPPKKTSKNKKRQDGEKKPAESPSQKSTPKKRSKPDETEKVIKKKRTKDIKQDSGRKSKA
uniref:RRM domain-containing protein n=1 Tax=Guillardia theta TaxID=55529 RepID=A0A6U6C2R1_GUITH